MATTYSKSLSTDFSGNLNPSQLRNELNADGGISPECIVVKNSGDDVDIVFDASLSGGEETTLNNLISAHIPISSYISSKSETVTATSLETYQTKTVLNKYVNVGEYKINWYYIFLTDDGYHDIRIIVDDSTVIHSSSGKLPIVSSIYRNKECGFNFVTLNEGIHNIKLQFKSTSNNTVTIECARLHIEDL